jgi:hypothetical protein
VNEYQKSPWSKIEPAQVLFTILLFPFLLLRKIAIAAGLDVVWAAFKRGWRWVGQKVLAGFNAVGRAIHWLWE